MTLITLSSQNQITLPKSDLRILGVQPYDKFFVRRKNNHIILEPIKESIAENTHGSLSEYVSAKKRDKTIDEIMEITKKKTAKKLATKK